MGDPLSFRESGLGRFMYQYQELTPFLGEPVSGADVLNSLPEDPVSPLHLSKPLSFGRCWKVAHPRFTSVTFVVTRFFLGGGEGF